MDHLNPPFTSPPISARADTVKAGNFNDTQGSTKFSMFFLAQSKTKTFQILGFRVNLKSDNVYIIETDKA